MKLLIAGLATGLLFTGAPAWADPWKDESGHGWRGKQSIQQVRHRDHRSERHDRHFDRRHNRGHSRHWERNYQRYDRHHYHPWTRHRDYYYRDYAYRYPAVEAPSVWFSWSLR